MKNRHTVIPAVWVIPTNATGQVYMVRRANTGWRDGWWTTPAGHVEKYEAPQAAAIRELKEEAGVTAEIEDLSEPLIYFYPEDVRENDRVSLFFRVTSYEGIPRNNEPNKADAEGWFDLDLLPEKVVPLLRQAFIDMKNNVRYSERYYDEDFHKELLY